MEIIKLEKVNEVYNKVICEPGVGYEIKDYFTFKVPNYQFMPAYKNKLWDGNIYLFNPMNCLLYGGLTEQLEIFCKSRDYKLELLSDFSSDNMSVKEALDFVKSLNLPFQPREYQLEAFVRCVRSRRKMLLSPTGCHKKDDLILKSDGTYIKVQNVKVGDVLAGPDGLPKKVVKLFNGNDDLYEIIPNGNRRKITVNSEHILPLKFSDSKSKYGYCKGNKDYIENISVKEYLKKSNYFKHCAKLFYNETPIKTKNQKLPCELSPYFIGLYIGDGSTHTCQVTTKDKKCIESIYEQANKLSMNVTTKDNLHYYIKGSVSKRNKIFAEFDKLGINFGSSNRISCEERFIPQAIFDSSISDRFEFLAGIIDSDGHLNSSKTYFELTFKSKQLAEDVERLAITLGLITTFKVKYNKKYDRNYYKTTILGNVHNIPTRLERKQASSHTRQQNRYKCGFKVNHIGYDEFYGFEVEDNLYITHSGMVTHNSGKSLIIYLLSRFYNLRTLIIVPTTSLIHQMASDFLSYGYSDPDNIHKIYQGQDKNTKSQYVISTWQSIFKQSKDWFNQFDVVIGDEAHLFKAKSLTSIMTKLENCKYRFGFTGTLDGSETHQLVLEGLFGPVKKIITTSELIEQKHLSNFMIKCISLQYPDDIKKECSKYSFQQEMDFLVSNQERNKFITNLSLSLKGNTLLLFQYVDKHGKVLYDMISNEHSDKDIYFVHGGIDGNEREKIRNIVEKNNNCIIIAFGDIKISCLPYEKIPLTNGTFKIAKEITVDDDINDSWILNRKMERS